MRVTSRPSPDPGKRTAETAVSQPLEFAPEVLPESGLASLTAELLRRGHAAIGPVAGDGAVVLRLLDNPEELALGVRVKQEAGKYLLDAKTGPVFLDGGPAANSAKSFFHPAEIRLFSAVKQDREIRVTGEDAPAAKLALIGLRPCDLAAVLRQDQILFETPFDDGVYRRRREHTLLIVFQCTQPAATCFCASMGTGPRAESGFDVALTAIEEAGEIVLLAEAGTPKGAELLAALPSRPAGAQIVQDARAAAGVAALRMKRQVNRDGLRDALYAAFDSPHWDEVAVRCLACGNCTSVCPTCFCTTVDESSSLDGRRAERYRRWDSCFTQGFSYIHGGSVRLSAKARYRQWLTHKFAYWEDQFGQTGCTGCGRCITWCPAGIDVTAEIAALRRAVAPAESPTDR